MPVFTMMVGIPGSGKSTLAERLAVEQEAVLVSTDRLRAELIGSAENRSRDRLVFARAAIDIQEALRYGLNVIYDATNLTVRDRARILRLLPPGTRKVCYYLKIPLEVALARNRRRERVVPTEVMEAMFRRLEEPTTAEGWDEIRIVEE
ncbi:MAG: ATP-binding protein [Firmicutes bacterium]|nr:ATP-binding protein [Bacillota bacterium]